MLQSVRWHGPGPCRTDPGSFGVVPGPLVCMDLECASVGPCACHDIIVMCACCGKRLMPLGQGFCRAFPAQVFWLHAQHVEAQRVCV